jgi:hypothetical protein
LAILNNRVKLKDSTKAFTAFEEQSFYPVTHTTTKMLDLPYPGVLLAYGANPTLK